MAETKGKVSVEKLVEQSADELVVQMAVSRGFSSVENLVVGKETCLVV